MSDVVSPPQESLELIFMTVSRYLHNKLLRTKKVGVFVPRPRPFSPPIFSSRESKAKTREFVALSFAFLSFLLD